MITDNSSALAEYQVSVFGSPVPNKFIDKIASPTPPPPVRTYQHNQQCQYDVDFPAGSMGLELEPVITSSERTIGCRVKDYYFGVSYDGLDRDYIQEHIAIGDIITKVNETSVVSFPFNSILDMLRALTTETRKITFKNITASWEVDYKKEHQNDTLSAKKSNAVKHQSHWAEAAIAAKGLISEVAQITAGTEPDALQQLRAKKAAVKKSGSDRKTNGLSPKRPLSNGTAVSTSKKSPPENRSLQKLLGYPVDPVADAKQTQQHLSIETGRSGSAGATSPFKLRNPTPNNDSVNQTFSFSVQDVDSSVQHVTSPTRKPKPPSDSPSPSSRHLHSQSTRDMYNPNPAMLMLNRSNSAGSSRVDRNGGSRSPLTPSSLLRLKQQQRSSGAASPTVALSRSTSAQLTPTGKSLTDGSERLRGVRVRLADESVVVEGESGIAVNQLATVGNPMAQFSDIMDKVRGSIGMGLVQVGNVLGARAERAISETSHLLPKYSDVEMNLVMSKKYDLLNELSQSCMLLGEAQEKEKLLVELQGKVKQLEEQVSQLQNTLEAAEDATESLKFKCKATETELSVLKVEHGQDIEALNAAKAEASQMQLLNADLQGQVAVSKGRVWECAAEIEKLKQELSRRDESWMETVQSSRDEAVELKKSVEAVTKKLRDAQEGRDRCLAELEVLQEMAASDKQSSAGECARLREAMASQQYLYKEQLVRHDAELHAVKRELNETKAGLATITELHGASEQDKSHLRSSLAKAESDINKLNAQLSSCQQELRSSQEELVYQKKLTTDAQVQLKEQQTQLVVSASEHGMLSDQAKMAELTVSALHTEIGMLRREVEEQRDLTKQKEMDAMTALSRYNTCDESLQVLKLEMEQMKQSQARILEDNQEEVSILETTIAGLREESLEQSRSRLEICEENERVVQQWQERCDKAEERIREMEQEKKALISTQDSVLRELQEELDALRSEHTKVVDAMAHLQVSFDTSQSDHESEILRTQDAQKVLSEEISNLKTAMAEAEEAFHAALHAKECELTSTQSKGECVENTLTQVRAEMNRLVLEHKQEMQSKDCEIVSLAESRNLIMQQLDAQTKSFEESLSSAKQRYDQREKEFISALRLAEDTQDSLRSDLHLQLAESTATCKAQVEELVVLKEQLESAHAQTSAFADKVKELEDSMGFVSSEIGDRKAEISLLESQRSLAEESSKRASAQVNELQRELSSLKDAHKLQLTESEKIAVQLKKSQDECVKYLDMHAKEVQIFQDQLEKSNAALTNNKKQSRAQQAALNAALEDVMVELATFKSNLSEAKTDITGLCNVHGSIVKSLVGQNHDLKAEMETVLSRQPGTLKLEGRLSQLLQEKEAACRRAAVAEQNTIESESRCVNALTRAMNAEKASADLKTQVQELRECLLSAESEGTKAHTELCVKNDAISLLEKKLYASSEERVVLERKLEESLHSYRHTAQLLEEARSKETTAMKNAVIESSRLKEQIENLLNDKAEQEKLLRSSHADQLTAASRLQDQCTSLQQQLDEARHKAFDKEAQYDEEKQSMEAQFEQKISSQRTELEKRHESMCDELRGELNSTCEAARVSELAWQKKLAAIEKMLESTALDLKAEHDRQISSLRNKLLEQEHSFSAKLDAKDSEISSLVEQLAADHDLAISKVEEAHCETIFSTQQHYKLLIDELSAEREALEEQLDSATTEVSQLKTSISSLQADKAAIEASFADQAAVVMSSNANIESLLEKVASTKRDLLALETSSRVQADEEAKKLELSAQSLKDAKEEATTLKGVIASLEDALREEAHVGQLLEKKVHLVQSELELREAALASTKKEFSELQRAVSILEGEKSSLLLDAQASKESLASLNIDLQAKAGEIQVLKRKLDDNEGSKQLEHASIAAVREELEVSLERKNDLKLQLDQAHLVQRAAEKQSNVLQAQVKELRETLMAQQTVIADAEARETEHMNHRRKYEQLLADAESKLTKTREEYTQVVERGLQERNERNDASLKQLQNEVHNLTSLLNTTQRALDIKCEELKSLHTHVTELLTSTFSPAKMQESARKKRTSGETDKENILSEVSFDHADSSSFHISEDIHCQTQWHARLVECSLHIYELLISAFQALKAMQSGKLPSNEAEATFVTLEQACVKLSLYQHQLHNLLAQTPWSMPGEKAVELSVPHDSFRALSSSREGKQLVNSGHAARGEHSHAVTHTHHAPPTAAEHARHHNQVTSPDRSSAVVSAVRVSTVTRRTETKIELSPPLLRSAPLGNSEDGALRESNDSVTLEDLLASLASNRSDNGSNNSSMCSTVRSRSVASHPTDGHHSLRSSTEDALAQASQVSAEIGEVSFDVFNDVALGATPPSIKRILRAADGNRSGGSSGGSRGNSSRRRDPDESFDSVVSDLFNLSADSNVSNSDDDSLFYYYREK